MADVVRVTADIAIFIERCSDYFQGWTFGFDSRTQGTLLLDGMMQPPDNRQFKEPLPGGIVVFVGVLLDAGVNGRMTIRAMSPSGREVSRFCPNPRVKTRVESYNYVVTPRVTDVSAQRSFHDDFRSSSATGGGKVAGAGEVSAGRGVLGGKLSASGERTWTNPNSSSQSEIGGSDSYVRQEVTGLDVKSQTIPPANSGALMTSSRFG